jgi:hypothetical protein
MSLSRADNPFNQTISLKEFRVIVRGWLLADD